MTMSAANRAAVRGRMIMLGLVATVLLALVFSCFVLVGRAQATVSYSDEEIAFVAQLNQYRTASGLQPLLLSDMISEACDRHGSDMGKYAFFSHNSLESDWFPYNATPWDRMAMSGYDYYTTKAENIAAGQATGAAVFTAWKNSSGHRANMLGSAFKVIGVSLMVVPGSPYTYYWVTDFGGYVDPTAHEAGQPPQPPTPSVARYEQADSRLSYSGTWGTYSTASASGGGYSRASSGIASVTVKFDGTYLAWIATRGTTLGKAYVSLDGGAAQTVDLYRSSVAYQQKVWSSGTISKGVHTVKIWRSSSNVAGKYVSVDAFDVAGTLQGAVVVAPAKTRYEQTDSHFVYSPAWATFTTSSASGGSYRRIATPGASVTVNFTGTRLAWIATAGTTLGKALVSLDGGPGISVDLARAAVAYQQNVWDSGALASGPHTVKIWYDPSNVTGKYISVDAFEVIGTLN